MRRLMTGLALIAVCAGCEADERAATAPVATAPVATAAVTATATAPPQASTARSTPSVAPKRRAARTARRFVGAPDVRVARDGDHVRVTARVDLPLPRGPYGVSGGFGIRGAEADIPGIDATRGVTRCYEEDLWMRGRRLRPGDRVIVHLAVGNRPDRTLTARAQVRAGLTLDDAARRRIVRELGCPRLPPERECGGGTGDLGPVIVRGGVSCATGQLVMRKVWRWAGRATCEPDLCASEHRMNAGFRCTVAQVGEADWSITCRRGAQVVRAGLSY